MSRTIDDLRQIVTIFNDNRLDFLEFDGIRLQRLGPPPAHGGSITTRTEEPLRAQPEDDESPLGRMIRTDPDLFSDRGN